MKYYIILPFSSVLSTVWYAAAATPYFSCSFHLKDLYDILYYKVQLQSNENFNLTQQAKMCKHVTKRMFISLVHSFGVFFFCKSMSFVSAWVVLLQLQSFLVQTVSFKTSYNVKPLKAQKHQIQTRRFSCIPCCLVIIGRMFHCNFK